MFVLQGTSWQGYNLFTHYANRKNNNQFLRLFESMPSTRGNDILKSLRDIGNGRRVLLVAMKNDFTERQHKNSKNFKNLIRNQ